MNPIGGYFELELRKGNEYHPKAISLNTGRNSLELILRIKQYKKVYIPYYTCNVLIEPFKKTNIPYEFYKIDKNLDPVFKKNLNANEALLYTNYFGIKDKTVKNLSSWIPHNLIVDNSQSFFSVPHKNIPTFYSCRKFFGVPDGAYLYLDDFCDCDLIIDCSEERFSHLFKRIEFGAEAGYNDFSANDNSLSGQPIKRMSKLTKALLCNIDYNFIRETRCANFLVLHNQLSRLNELSIRFEEESVPMVYPFLTNKSELKQKLIENRIFVATYWPNVIGWVSDRSIEYKLASGIIPLPIDQRYTVNDMKHVLELLALLFN